MNDRLFTGWNRQNVPRETVRNFSLWPQRKTCINAKLISINQTCVILVSSFPEIKVVKDQPGVVRHKILVSWWILIQRSLWSHVKGMRAPMQDIFSESQTPFLVERTMTPSARRGYLLDLSRLPNESLAHLSLKTKSRDGGECDFKSSGSPTAASLQREKERPHWSWHSLEPALTRNKCAQPVWFTRPRMFPLQLSLPGR